MAGTGAPSPLIAGSFLNNCLCPVLLKTGSVYQRNGLLKEFGRAPPIWAQGDHQDVCSMILIKSSVQLFPSST